jgi:two-component system, chemotaxis family, chemotaxis protein CheY
MNANILIVDDSAILRKVMRKAIGQLGVQAERIFEAGDGQQALDLLAEQPIDLILLDMHMPVMNGHEFAQIKAKDTALSAVPFVVVSTEANAMRLMEMVELGALGVLRKPFEPEDLRRMVADYLPDETLAASSAQTEIVAEKLPGLECEQLDALIANALERTAFVLTDHADSTLPSNYNQHAHITYVSDEEEADIFLSASEGFLREFAASMLGMDEDDPEVAHELVAGLTELANILAGEIVVCLGGEEKRFVLGIPQSCAPESVPASSPSVSCARASMGEGLEVNVFRRRVGKPA